MPICTGLAPDPRRPGYRVVEVDRGRFASLPEDALAPLELAPGRDLTPAMLGRLEELADAEGAYQAALRLERLRSHAIFDLRRRLVHKQHPARAVDAALQRLEWQGLLDDRRFAETYARSRVARGRGPSRVIRDLRAQGVERRLAEEMVARAIAEEGIDTAAAAREVAERRAAQMAELPLPARRRRLTAYLARRGYVGAEVRELVKELCG